MHRDIDRPISKVRSIGVRAVDRTIGLLAMLVTALLRAYAAFKGTEQSASDPEDDSEGITKRDIVRGARRRKVQRCGSTSAERVYVCGVKYTPKHSRADGCTHNLRVRSVKLIELRATEPAEDALHPEKIHTAVILYGEDSSLCCTFTTEL